MASKAESKYVEFLKSDLPYGLRISCDGTAELFNRRYETIVKKQSKPRQEPNTMFFYNDKNPPWVNEETRLRCEAELRRFRERNND